MTAQLAVVLVEPSGPLNVGSVARLCANFGVDSLRLVAPRCDPADPQAKQMAVRGLEQLLKAANGHLLGLGIGGIAARGHQPQRVHTEIGAQASHAAHIQRATGFHQHHGQLGRHCSSCR